MCSTRDMRVCTCLWLSYMSCVTACICTGNRDIEALIVKCSNEVHGCKWEGELRKIGAHLNECTNGVLLCKYSSIGCNIKASSDDMSAHEKICAEEHLKMAVQKVNLLELQLAEMKAQLGTSSEMNLPPVVFKMTSFELYPSTLILKGTSCTLGLLSSVVLVGTPFLSKLASVTGRMMTTWYGHLLVLCTLAF